MLFEHQLVDPMPGTEGALRRVSRIRLTHEVEDRVSFRLLSSPSGPSSDGNWEVKRRAPQAPLSTDWPSALALLNREPRRFANR
jgi:hypothetical protein